MFSLAHRLVLNGILFLSSFHIACTVFGENSSQWNRPHGGLVSAGDVARNSTDSVVLLMAWTNLKSRERFNKMEREKQIMLGSWQVSFEVQWSDIERVVWCLCWGWSFGIVGAVGASGRMHSLCLPAIAQFGENSEAGGGLARQKDTCSLIKRSNGCQQCWGEANNTHAKY